MAIYIGNVREYEGSYKKAGLKGYRFSVYTLGSEGGFAADGFRFIGGKIYPPGSSHSNRFKAHCWLHKKTAEELYQILAACQAAGVFPEAEPLRSEKLALRYVTLTPDLLFEKFADALEMSLSVEKLIKKKGVDKSGE
jgi:predicted HicB family RNase H-like nuclease